ncbi:MAG: L-threonylcarbamoyladenylate synthase [Dehalococcoidia bacterium]
MYKNELESSFNLLKKGEIIAMPTDTFYGLSCDPFNKNAVENLFNLKDRDKSKPLPLLISNKNDLLKFDVNFFDFEPILDAFWPGPLTIVVKTNYDFLEGMVKSDGYVGFRVPKLKFAIDLMNLMKSPLTGTSANISGQPETKDINVIKDSLNLKIIKKVVNISCGDEKSVSTVIKFSSNKIKLLRKGPVKLKQIAELLDDRYEYE